MASTGHTKDGAKNFETVRAAEIEVHRATSAEEGPGFARSGEGVRKSGWSRVLWRRHPLGDDQSWNRAGALANGHPSAGGLPEHGVRRRIHRRVSVGLAVGQRPSQGVGRGRRAVHDRIARKAEVQHGVGGFPVQSEAPQRHAPARTTGDSCDRHQAHRSSPDPWRLPHSASEHPQARGPACRRQPGWRNSLHPADGRPLARGCHPAPARRCARTLPGRGGVESHRRPAFAGGLRDAIHPCRRERLRGYRSRGEQTGPVRPPVPPDRPDLGCHDQSTLVHGRPCGQSLPASWSPCW